MAKGEVEAEKILDELLLLLEDDEDEEDSMTLNGEDKPKFLRCQFCRKLFDSQSSLRNHETFTHLPKVIAKGEKQSY